MASLYSNSPQRIKLLMKNYYIAKVEGIREGTFDIEFINPDKYEEFYIYLKPKIGIYRDQIHIVEMKTTYKYNNRDHYFPINPPKMRFLTKIYHTNIGPEGDICVDILKNHDNKWLPTYGFKEVIVSILVLLEFPNPLSAYNSQAGQHYQQCEKRFTTNKHKYTDVEQLEIFKQEVFADYKTIADKQASTPLDSYIKYFPQIIGQSKSKEELDEIYAAYNRLIKPTVRAPIKKSEPSQRWKIFQKNKNLNKLDDEKS